MTGFYSSIIQKYTIDYRKMKETQNKMKDFQKDYREAMLSKDEKRIKKIEAKRDTMMKDQLEMSQAQFKPMGYIMVITLPIFFWLYFRLNNYDASHNHAVLWLMSILQQQFSGRYRPG